MAEDFNRMMRFSLFAFAIFPAITFASIDGKGLLCTCVEERAVRVLTEPETLAKKLESVLGANGGDDSWRPLECADRGSAYYEKFTLTKNHHDVDSFFLFSNGSVTEEVLVKVNEDFSYHVIADYPAGYITDTAWVSWYTQFESFKLGRRSLQLVRQWQDSRKIIEVSQCQVFDSFEELKAAKDQYKQEFEQSYQDELDARGNQL